MNMSLKSEGEEYELPILIWESLACISLYLCLVRSPMSRDRNKNRLQVSFRVHLVLEVKKRPAKETKDTERVLCPGNHKNTV